MSPEVSGGTFRLNQPSGLQEDLFPQIPTLSRDPGGVCYYSAHLWCWPSPFTAGPV